ncbi:hypothetical protein [Mesorhizobium wenxiniae]|uniref:hypothetical protein n=1 Tax=Mesorhizobium wenxiniae TaxID=2014805 RepID=UPI001FDA232A|nr:hypothetical protein [Mesorhizobium wenxiniae]
MRIAVGEEADELLDDGKDPAAKALGEKGGKKHGGVASSGCPTSPTAAAALARMNAGIDVGGVVAAICAPTLLIHRRNDARSIPTPAASWPGRSRMRGWSKGPGRDHPIWTGDVERVADLIEEFLTGERAVAEAERLLAALLATRIYDTARLATAWGASATNAFRKHGGCWSGAMVAARQVCMAS